MFSAPGPCQTLPRQVLQSESAHELSLSTFIPFPLARNRTCDELTLGGLPTGSRLGRSSRLLDWIGLPSINFIGVDRGRLLACDGKHLRLRSRHPRPILTIAGTSIWEPRHRL